MRDETPPIEQKEHNPNFVKKDECPVCLQPGLDSATFAGLGQAKPRPGDFSICIYCTSILKFDEQLNLCTTSEEEVEETGMLEELNRTIDLIKEFKKIHPLPSSRK